MGQFPVFFKLDGRRVVIAGSSAAAAAKLRLVARSGAAVEVFAPAPGPALRAALAETGARLVAREATATDFPGADLAYVATGAAATDARLAAHARKAGVPVNVVDRPELCTFTTPAIVDRDPIIVAIGSDGTAPTLARRVRAAIDRLLPARLGTLARLAQEFRDSAGRALPHGRDRRRFWEALFSGPAARLALQGDEAGARAEALRTLNSRTTRTAPPRGVVHLVGAGPGDPDLLTLKAHRLLQTADAIVHDDLSGAPVLELARRDAERHYVGKRKGRHAASQDEINALLVRLAREGKTVVRLKGGDPSVFGRATEELAALRAAGIAAEVVPGITAASACAASAGVSLTHRDHAQAVTFVTGHRKAGADHDIDWAALAHPGHTIAVYMGLSRAGAIAGALIGHGLPATTPAKVIVNGSCPDQRILSGTLADLGDLAARAEGAGPGLLLIGEAVGAATATVSSMAEAEMAWPFHPQGPAGPSLTELAFPPPFSSAL